MISYIAKHLVYPAHEWLMKRPTFSYLDELEKTQWFSSSELEQLQMAKLKQLLQSAVKHCPWHAQRIQRAGLELDDSAPMLTPSDLQRLPTMTKHDAIQHGPEMVWKGVPGGAYKYSTGGSSGEPLMFYFGRLRQASDAAGRMRARRWWGVDVGDPEVYLWGAPVELNKTDRIKTWRDRLMNQLVLNAFEMGPVNMDEYIRAIQSYNPCCIYGYASSIALLAAHSRRRKRGFALPRLKVVCTTGEPLYDHQRELIQDVFGVPVASEYGSRDIGFTAHETPEGKMLLMNESIILEVLDEQGRPVAPGEEGEAVMTGLCSHAQPFIRYRTGDRIRRAQGVCGDGRGLQVVGEVMGRSTDFIVRSDGTIMHALAVIYVLRAVEGVEAFKFIQHAVDSVEILLVKNSRWVPASEAEIRRGIARRLGENVSIDLRFMDAIPAEASGKYRYVVSHVAMD